MLLDQHVVKIKVIGVGGAGGNAINDMIESGVTGVEYIAANTDAQDLARSLADIRLQLGEKLTEGLGAGANPEIGRQSAEESIEQIKKLMEETKLLFITAGMGGGTGTGAAPVIAKAAKEMGILTVAVVTRPFEMEGKKKERNANNGIEELKKVVDSLVVIPNEKLFELPDKNITFMNAFKEANNILKIGIKGIADLMLVSGYINLDFADIKATLSESGVAVLGFGEGEGENKAVKATEKALESPLLEKSIMGASKLLINIIVSPDFQLADSKLISNMVAEAAGKNSQEDVMFGVVMDETLEDKVQVTIIANGFDKDSDSSETFINVEEKNMEDLSNQRKEEKEATLDVPPFLRNK